MTTIKELRVDQVRDLSLHQSDTLTVIAEQGETLSVEIRYADRNRVQKASAGDWGRQYLGAAKPPEDATPHPPIS